MEQWRLTILKGLSGLKRLSGLKELFGRSGFLISFGHKRLFRNGQAGYAASIRFKTVYLFP